MFLVGGFSESPILEEIFRKEFGRDGLRIIKPKDSELAILKGAVLFGLKSDQIESRVLKLSYGVEERQWFDPDIHDEKHRYIFGSDDLCGEIFFCLAQTGERIMTHWHQFA